MTNGTLADAWICWGINDGGTTATSAWQNVVSMGSVMKGAQFSTVASGLSNSVIYWYRCYATNAYGTAWSDVPTSFSATPGGGSIIVNLAPTGITNSSAILNATLYAPARNYDVYVYWGPTDGTNNIGAWAGSAYVGSWTNVASINISYTNTSLAPNTTYYYTFRATNWSTNVWAAPSERFSTPLSPGIFYWINTISSVWSGSANWTNDLGTVAAPATAGQTNYVLNFNQAGSYTASNDLGSGFMLNQLNFGSSAGGMTLAGNSLDFTNNGVSMPQFNQNGSAAAIISNGLVFATNVTFGGSGAGLVTIAGAISGAGSLTMTNAGTLALSGTNTYTGTTVINAGTLRVSGQTGSASGTGSGAVQVNAGGTLSGNGRIGGAVTVANATNAVFYPNTNGTLTVGGNLTFGGSSSVVKFNLSGTTNGANDKVVLDGSNKTLACGGAQITINSTGTLDSADYVLFDAGASGTNSGSFNTTPAWIGTTPKYSTGYSITNVGNTVVLRYTPIQITVTAAANTKTYDGNTNAPTATPSFSLQLGDSGTFTEYYTDKNVGIGNKTLNAILVGAITNGGGNNVTARYNINYAPCYTGTITPATLTITNAVAQNKKYDGGTNAVINGTLSGVIIPDVVTLNLTGCFLDPEVGTGKPVTSTSTIGGDDAGNYFLAQPTGLTADIETTGAGGLARITEVNPTNADVKLQFSIQSNCTVTIYATDSPSTAAVRTVVGIITNIGSLISTNLTEYGAVTNSPMRRFYTLVVTNADGTYTNTEEWAMYVQPRQSNRWVMAGMPVDFETTNENTLASTLGAELTRGIKQGVESNGDLVYMLGSTNFVKYWSPSNTVWWTTTGAASNTTIQPWTGFWVQKRATSPSANAVYTGRARTNLVYEVPITNGWNFLAWPCRTDRKESDGAPGDEAGWGFKKSGGIYSTIATNADTILLVQGNSWKRYYLLSNGRWWDYLKGGYADFTMQTGQGFYYYRRSATGFVWTNSYGP